MNIEDKWQNAREQAQAQFESLREMVEALHNALTDDEEAHEAAQTAIHESALSVEVRSDWYVAGRDGEDTKPAEYRVLLCTGGPAVQITGHLSEHGEPETACLQMQDWFLPWTDYRPEDNAKGAETGRTELIADAEETLLVYARQFYFGE